MEAAVLVGLILINGFFAMSEISLVTARKARLRALIDAGDKSARIAARLGAEPTKFLSTIQIGITSVGLLSGIVGQATLAPPLEAELVRLGVPEQASSYVATGLVVALVTYFAIVVGELVPKRLGQIHAERVARFVARPIQTIALCCKPFVWLLSASTRALLRLLAVDDKRRSIVTEEEIHALLLEGSEAGVIDEQEHRMVRNLFRLDHLAIVSFMTPRADIVSLDVESPPEHLLALLDRSPHSRYPVVRGGFQDVVGVVAARELLRRTMRGDPLDLEAAVEPAMFLPESISGMDLLQHFRSRGDHMALIVNEYGRVLGLITLHDLLEGITGSIETGSPDDAWAVPREDGSWLFDGQLSIHELFDHLGVPASRGRVTGDYQTLSGLLIQELGRLPRTGDRVPVSLDKGRGWMFEVVDMDGHRIDKVLAWPIER